MNILMVTNEFHPSIGGVQTHVFELSRALVKLGHRVSVLTRHKNKSLPEFEILDGINVYRCKLVNSHLIYNWQLRWKLNDLVESHSIQVIHVHGMRPLTATKNLGVPVVFTNHTSSFLKRSQKGERVRRKMLKQLQAASVVLAPSQILVDQTRATGYSGKVQFISNGVDTSKFTPGTSKLRERLSIPDKAFVAIMTGRLVAVKGLIYLAKAIVKLDHPELHLMVAGEGNERAEFESIIQSSSCSERVHMLGAVANSEMPDTYRAADVAILPSLMEATSIAGLEAMACGLPVIGTRVGGIPVLINDGMNGLLVEPKSSEGLEAAIQTLLADRLLAKKMGKESLLRATNEFSWERIAQQVVEIYLSTRDAHG